MKKITIVLMSFLSFYIQAGQVDLKIEHRETQRIETPHALIKEAFEDKNYYSILSPSGAVVAFIPITKTKQKFNIVFCLTYKLATETQNQLIKLKQRISSFEWETESHSRPYKVKKHTYKNNREEATEHYLYKDFPDFFTINGDKTTLYYFDGWDIKRYNPQNQTCKEYEHPADHKNILRNKAGNPNIVPYDEKGKLINLDLSNRDTGRNNFDANRWFVWNRHADGNQMWVEIIKDEKFKRGEDRVLKRGVRAIPFLQGHSSSLFPNQSCVAFFQDYSTICDFPCRVERKNNNEIWLIYKGFQDKPAYTAEEPIHSLAFSYRQPPYGNSHEIEYFAVIGNSIMHSSKVITLSDQQEFNPDWFIPCLASNLFPNEQSEESLSIPFSPKNNSAASAHQQANRTPSRQANQAAPAPIKPQKNLAWRFMQSLRASIFNRKITIGLGAASAFYVYRYGFTAQPLRSLFFRGPIQLYSWRR